MVPTLKDSFKRTNIKKGELNKNQLANFMPYRYFGLRYSNVIKDQVTVSSLHQILLV